MTTHGKHSKRKRGAHKSARSPETRRWEAEHLIPKPPPWMSAAAASALARLRETL